VIGVSKGSNAQRWLDGEPRGISCNGGGKTGLGDGGDGSVFMV
jgi:hypothetical protein